MHDNDSQLFTIPLKFKIKLLDFTVLKFHLQYYIFFFFLKNALDTGINNT